MQLHNLNSEFISLRIKMDMYQKAMRVVGSPFITRGFTCNMLYIDKQKVDGLLRADGPITVVTDTRPLEGLAYI